MFQDGEIPLTPPFANAKIRFTFWPSVFLPSPVNSEMVLLQGVGSGSFLLCHFPR
jgi:hypothetical protein